MIAEIDVEACRDRDGEAGDRPEEIDNLLNWRQLGYEMGDPLAAESYSGYPDNSQELSAPKYSELIRRLFRSPAVNGYDDAVTELTPAARDRTIASDWRESLQRAAGAADIDAGQLLAEGDETDCGGPHNALKALTDDLPRHIVGEDNPLCLTHLYGDKSLSVGEIAEIFETDESMIRQRLHDVGLVVRREDRPDGKTAEDILVEMPAVDGEIPENPSVDVNTEAIVADDNVTYQKGEE
jgi:hypothetical protein